MIMSATLRLDDFLANRQVFPRKLNLIKVQTRQFPVKTFFSKTYEFSYKVLRKTMLKQPLKNA